MPVAVSALLTITLILLLPLVPTLVIYKVIRDRRTRAGAQGTLLGLKIESSGAIASYIICAALTILVAQNVIPKDYVAVQVIVQMSGDPDIVNRFLEKAETGVQLIMTGSGGQPITFDHFKVNLNQKTISAEREVPPSLIGATLNPDLSFAGDHMVIKPNPVILQKTNFLQMVLGGESQRRAWTAFLDTTSHVFANQAQDLYSKEIILLTHDSPDSLESIILHNYLISAPLVYLEVAARVVDRKSLDGMMQQWSRASLASLSADGYRAYFDARFEEYKVYGDELAIRHFTNDSYNLPNQGIRFKRGNISLLDADHLIPIIGPVPGGIASDKAVIVVVDIWWKTFPEYQQRGAELTLGQTFERPTRRALFGVSSAPERQVDLPSVRAQYKQDLVTPVNRLGDAVVRKGANSVTLDLEELLAGSGMQVFWSWR